MTWSTEVHRGWSSLVDLSGWWNSQPVVGEIPFIHTRLLEVWGSAFAKPDEKLQVRILKRNGEPVAAIPLLHRPGRFNSLSTTQVDPTDVVVVPDEEVSRHVPRWLSDMPVAHLHYFREESPLVQALSEYPRWVLRKKKFSPYLDLTHGSEAAHSNMSPKSRSTLRRRWRRLREMGEVTYVEHPQPSDVTQVLDAGFRLEAAGWKGRNGHAVLHTPEYERFYRGLAEVGEDEGWLRLSTLYLDDRMLAFHLNIVYGDRCHLMLTTFDELDRFSNLSLGTLLMDAVIESGCEQGLLSCEFGYPWAPAKEQWTSTAHTVYSFSIYGSGVRGRLMRARHTR